MKKNIINYTFNSAQKTIKFNDYANIEIEKILQISNVKTAEIIYSPINFGDSVNRKGTVTGNVINLSFNTTSMNNSDPLQIWYDDGIYDSHDSDGNLLISDNIHFENSYGTKNSQIVTSQQEHFWANLARRGKLVSGIREGVAITGGVESQFSMLGPYKDRICVLEKLNVSANVDITLRIQVITGISSENFYISGGYIKAGEQYNLDFNGNIRLYEGDQYIGALEIYVKPITSGQIWIYNQGWSIDNEQ